MNAVYLPRSSRPPRRTRRHPSHPSPLMAGRFLSTSLMAAPAATRHRPTVAIRH
ncbi:MAG: hypothetical protein LBI02_01430 [Opitutaceae bacterium]|nr:hypothetical protein [Opitutaceae bacterium]